MTGRCRILYLEDDKKDFELAQALLESESIVEEMIRVDNKADFISALEREKIGLILADYSLPDFDGLTALKIAQEEYPYTPFIILSGTMGEELAIEALKEGAADYVLKQRIKRLIPAVKRAIRESDEKWKLREAEETISRQNQLIRNSEEAMRSLINAITESAVLLDLVGEVLAINETASKRMGVAVDKIIGKSVYDFLPADIVEERKLRFQEIVQTKKPVRYENIRSGRNIDNSLYPVFDSEGDVTRIAMFEMDITESILAEEQIRKSLKEKEILLSEIHHRVKNNMQIISSLLNLQANYITNEKDRELFQNSQDRIHAMALIHEKLYESGNFTEINFKEYIHDLVSNLIVSYIPRSNNIKFSLDIEDIHLDISEALPCAQILNELITNSIKHAFNDDQKGEIEISFHMSNNGYILTVSDNGRGIPQGIDFENSKTLGMKLVDTLARQLKGTIDVDRSRGTRFIIKFGHDAVQRHEESNNELKGVSKTMGKPGILIVEDDSIIAMNIMEIFKDRDYRVVDIAATGEEAVKFVEKNIPGLILIDVRLNGEIDGIETVKLINSNRNIPVIYCTGNTDDNVYKRAMETKPAGFFIKPIDFDEMFLLIESIFS